MLRRLLTIFRGSACAQCRLHEQAIRIREHALKDMQRTVNISQGRVEQMQSEIQDLRAQRDLMQHNLLKAVRLESGVTSVTPGRAGVAGTANVQQTQQSKSWNRQRSALEMKHRKPNPEADKTAQYWRDKQAALEAEAGVNAASQQEMSQDVEELSRA